MDFSNFKAPFIRKDRVQSEADKFREQLWPAGSIPVDIHEIIEFELHMEIRAISNLSKSSDIDALLLGDLQTIVVDWDMYMDDRRQNRIRYSLAHEVGHKILHPDLYSQIRHSSIAEWIAFFEAIPQDEYTWIEQHAYEFAGRLLVPPVILKQAFDEQIVVVKKQGFEDWDTSGESALEYMAHAIAAAYPFEVSEQVIARRLKIEGFWKVVH